MHLDITSSRVGYVLALHIDMRMEYDPGLGDHHARITLGVAITATTIMVLFNKSLLRKDLGKITNY